MPTETFDINDIKMPNITILGGADFEYSELTVLDFAECIIDIIYLIIPWRDMVIILMIMVAFL